MDGLSDLIFFAVLAWFVLRLAGRTARRDVPPGPPSPPEPRSPPAPPWETTAKRPEAGDEAPVKRPERAPGGLFGGTSARRMTPMEELRRRLLAEAERWEAERQRVETARRLEVTRPPETARRPETTRQEGRPGLAEVTRAETEEAPPSAGTVPRPERVRETPPPPGRRVGRTPVPPVAGASGSGPEGAVRARRRQGRFPEFGGRSPLQRAILYSELLGPPKGAEDPQSWRSRGAP